MNIEKYAVPAEDRCTFVKFMALLSVADAELSIEEKQTIDSIIFAWKLKEDEIKDVYTVFDSGVDIKELASEFHNRRSGYLLIQELITLSKLDGHYAEEERKAIGDIAQALNISAERVLDIESWVEEGIVWREKGIKLITSEGE